MFALAAIKLTDSLPRTRVGEVIGRQLLRSATSVAANYRAACRAKSPADFVSKIGTVEEEADESLFWLELLVESGIASKSAIEVLMNEANQLVAIAVSSGRTAKSRTR